MVGLLAFMQEPGAEILYDLEAILLELYKPEEDPWNNRPFQEIGVTPRMLIEFAKRRGLG